MNKDIGKGKPPKHTQFKKGKSGNPEGARKHDPLKRALKKITSKELAELIDCILTGTEETLREELANKDTSIIKLIVGKTALQASKNADWKLFDKLLDRVIGKPKQKVEAVAEKLPGEVIFYSQNL